MNVRTPAAALAFASALALTLGACQRNDAATQAQRSVAVQPANPIATRSEPNSIALRIDGREWRADRAIDVIVDPPGFDRMLMVSGSFGPKDRNEQAFNLNLAGVDGPGRYAIHGGNAVGSAVQLANLDGTRYLIGGSLGADVVVDISRFERAPIVVEGTFSGTMVANDGNALRIEDGRFSFRE